MIKEIRRVLKNPGFWLAVFLGVFSMIHPHMNAEMTLEYFRSGDFLYFMLMPLRYGLAKLFLPLIAVLPAAAFLAEDQRRRYHLFLYYRYGAWGYMRQRIKLSVIAAMLAAFLGFMLYAVFVGLICPWHDNIVYSWRDLSGLPFDGWINNYEGLPFLLLSLFCLLLSSAVWAMVGFSLSCFTNNTGIVIGGTFLAHYMASWLFSSILHIWDWSPMVLQTPLTYYSGSIWMIIVRLGIWLMASIIVATGCAKHFLNRIKE